MSTVSSLSHARARRTRGLALNLAIGPSCFVRCSGCYNLFGRTASRGGLVTTSELRPLVSAAQSLGVNQVTVSGGDPLTHPEILEVLGMLRDYGFYIKLDTVGTAFLRDAQIYFYGSGSVSQIDPATIAPLIDMVGLPLDGSSGPSQERFRSTGPDATSPDAQPALFDLGPVGNRRRTTNSSASVVADTPALVRTFKDLAVEVCVNTVVHSGNLKDLPAIALQVERMQPELWQIFEFQSTGIMAQHNRERFQLDRDRSSAPIDMRQERSHQDELFPKIDTFHSAVHLAQARAVGVRVEAKSAAKRSGIYFIVNDAGVAWMPAMDDESPNVLGHVVRDLDLLVEVLRSHVANDAV